MCEKIAYIIQGKASPHYKPNKVEYTDKCIIVNAKYTYLTGKKLEQKLYYHHTGYPGGLKSITAKLYLEKDPTEMIMRSIKGMTPKNCMRPYYLSKVKIYHEGAHDLHAKGIPQFGKTIPVDYNEIFDVKNISPETHVMISTNMEEKDIPPQFKDFERKNDQSFETTEYAEPSEFKVNQKKIDKYNRYVRRDRYIQYKRIRNMAYRYI
jgi:large subunit ribosomal protein L13